ncbi:hypothetical protein TNCV_702371 [Trichonephila clavipes]|nr:hypothetical protein TNCV_702371 [Trichonephila clavipes]
MRHNRGTIDSNPRGRSEARVQTYYRSRPLVSGSGFQSIKGPGRSSIRTLKKKKKCSLKFREELKDLEPVITSDSLARLIATMPDVMDMIESNIY